MTKIEKLEEILTRFKVDQHFLKNVDRHGYVTGLEVALAEIRKLKSNTNISDEVLPEKYGFNEIVFDEKVFSDKTAKNEDINLPIPKEAILEMKLREEIKNDFFNKLNIQNLDTALRMTNITVDLDTLDRLIDVVELVLEKGNQVSIKDISELNNPK